MKQILMHTLWKIGKMHYYTVLLLAKLILSI